MVFFLLIFTLYREPSHKTFQKYSYYYLFISFSQITKTLQFLSQPKKVSNFFDFEKCSPIFLFLQKIEPFLSSLHLANHPPYQHPSFTMSSVASTQVIDVKAKKPRAPKKEKTPASTSETTSTSVSATATDVIPPPTDSTVETKKPSDTKKPRAPKKVKASTTDESPATPTESVTNDADTDAKQKKPRTPTLPAKFAKFIKFNFFFINQLSDVDQDTKDAYLKTFAVFAPVDQQTQIVTDFLLTQKSVNKDYRSALSAQKKAIAKANKPQRRSKKSVQVDFQNNLVNQLIESANQPDNESTVETKEKKPRGRKPKNSDSTPNESSDSTPKDAKDAKEKKPRGRKPKQTEAVVETSQPTSASDANDEAEDTEVSRFVHGGKSFLRDRENNLYDELSHEPVGEYDPANDSVVLL